MMRWRDALDKKKSMEWNMECLKNQQIGQTLYYLALSNNLCTTHTDSKNRRTLAPACTTGPALKYGQ